MKTIKYIYLLLASILIVSCSDDFLDVNTPSNGTTEDQLAIKDLLEPIIRYTFDNQYIIESSVGQYSQHLASRFSGDGVADNHYEVQLAGAWSNLYLRSLTGLNSMINKANEENAIHYRGISKILKAVNIGMATDQWGSIPYSEAVQGEVDFTPGYDDQQSVYIEIDNLLAEGIADLSAADSSTSQPGSEDIIYGGDLDKWIKAAYTLRARYALHLTKVNGVTAAQTALGFLANGFNSNDDDFQVSYTTRTKNPWYANVVIPNGTGNFSLIVSDQLISLMDGSQYPFNTISQDPRLPFYCDKGTDATYKGAVNGTAGLALDGSSANTDLGSDNFYSKETSPVVLISYSEALFIKAEAQFLVDGGTATSTGASLGAYTAYKDAIMANMDKLNVSDGSAYVLDSSVDVGEANLEMHHIMKEKFIALFLNPESFVDIRRYDFSSMVFRGLDLPVDANPDNGGQWVRRAVYPTSERDGNLDNYNAELASLTQPVWWDQ